MPLVGLTRAGIVAPIVGLLEERGAPVDAILLRAHVPACARTDSELLIPTVSVARILVEGVRSLGIGHLGLLAGQDARIDKLGTFGHLIRRAPTLRHAIDELVTDHPAFSSNGRMWLRPRGDHVELCQAFDNKFDPFDEGWQQASHYALALMIGVIRLAGDGTWRPAEVRLQTGESAGLHDAKLLASARLRFRQSETAIAVPRALLGERLQPPDGDVALARKSIEAWRASAPPRDFVGAVGLVVEVLSWEGYPDIHLTAEVLGLSVRTLQRHLAAAGFTHESLVGRARFATAVAVLEETDTKILEIALDLGYSDHAHFTRAFRRWAGCSPQEYRRRRRPGHDTFGPSGIRRPTARSAGHGS